MSLSVEELREIEQELARSVELSEVMARSSWSPQEAHRSAGNEFKRLLAIRELIAIKEAEQMKRVNSPKFYSRQRGALEEVDEDLQALMDRDMED